MKLAARVGGNAFYNLAIAAKAKAMKAEGIEVCFSAGDRISPEHIKAAASCLDQVKPDMDHLLGAKVKGSDRPEAEN